VRFGPAGLVWLSDSFVGQLYSDPPSSAQVATAVLDPITMMPLGVARVAWSIYTGPPAGHLLDRHLESALPQKAGAPHVLWLLFDEWDESLTYRHRPANLELPELDRFRSHAFDAVALAILALVERAPLSAAVIAKDAAFTMGTFNAALVSSTRRHFPDNL